MKKALDDLTYGAECALRGMKVFFTRPRLWPYALPPLLVEQLAVLTDEIFEGRNPSDLPPRKRIAAVVRFFSDNFT